MAWFLNHYRCEECNVDWSDEWDATCDDECPECGVSYTPVSSDDLPDEEE